MCMQMKRNANNSATSQLLLHDPMTPSVSATPRRSPRGPRAVARRRRRRNAASARTPLVGGSATARALAAGLWRLRHAERQALGPASRRRDGPIEACAELPYCSMEKATKWDHVYLNNLDDMFGSHDPRKLPRATVVLEAELEQSRTRIRELADEERVTRKKLERFLRRLAEEKALWKSRMRANARNTVAALTEDVKAERKHRRRLEAANTRLMDELAEAKLSAKRLARSYEVERKARELMEVTCDELTREAEEDQAEVELLRRECLSLRGEMEEERRMLQMAEVWREERVQMKLSDAKAALEHKCSQLDRLQAEMESFLGRDGEADDADGRGFLGAKEFHHRNPHVELVSRQSGRREGGAMANGGGRHSPAAASDAHSVSPATDIFLGKPDDASCGANGSVDLENGGSGWATPRHGRRRDSCASAGSSDPPSAAAARASDASLPNGEGWDAGSGVTEVHSAASRRSGKKNTALIRRLWRSAISESREKAGSGGTGTQTNGWPPSSGRRSALATAPTLPAAEQCGPSGSVQLQGTREPKGSPRGGGGVHRRSLKEKLMEARMDDQKDKPCYAVKQKIYSLS